MSTLAGYTAEGQEAAVTTGYTTVVHVAASGGTANQLTRARIYEFEIGSGGAPADNAIDYILQRHTALPTSTVIVAEPNDPADEPSRMYCGENASAEGAYSAGKLWRRIINQRTVYRWVSVDGGEIVIPLVTANGVGIRVKHASYTGTAEAGIKYWE